MNENGIKELQTQTERANVPKKKKKKKEFKSKGQSGPKKCETSFIKYVQNLLNVNYVLMC